MIQFAFVGTFYHIDPDCAIIPPFARPLVIQNERRLGAFKTPVVLNDRSAWKKHGFA
jgi:hypothetical protein